MARLTAYRVQVHRAPESGEVGTHHVLQKPDYDSAHYDFEATPICIQLAEDVRVARSGAGVWLLYRDYQAYGLRLDDALRAGWVKEVETPETWPASAGEEDEAALPADPEMTPTSRSFE